MTEGVTATRKGDIYEITLDRPEAGNAVTDEAVVRLGDLLENVEQDVRVIVIRGAGKDFCAGRAPPPPPARPLEALEMRRAHDIVFRVYGAVRKSQIPTIALVQGRALGFGFALAASADITIAADTARFQIPEFAHRIMPTMVMSALIDRVPLKALMYHVYTATEFNPERALAIGAISDICPERELEQRLAAVLASMTKAPRPALLAVKEYAREAQAIDVQKAVQYGRSLHAMVNTSSEMRK
jgi:enoyl-CoA hydratase